MTCLKSALSVCLWLCFALVLLPSCGEHSQSISSLELVSSQQDDPSSAMTTLAYGQTVQLTDPEVEIVLLDVLEDSRCPRDVYCLWSGRLRVALQLQYGDERKETIVLGQGPGVSSVFQNEVLSIQLIDALPEAPRLSQEVILADYEIRIAVTTIEKSFDLFQLLNGVRLSTLYDKQFGLVEFEFLNDQAYMILDRNTCRLDIMGQTTACSKMAVFRRSVTLQQVSNFQNKVFLYRLESSENFGLVVDLPLSRLVSVWSSTIKKGKRSPFALSRRFKS